MNKILKYFFVFCAVAMFAGCATIEETAKSIWGSSTKALEEARLDALTQSFSCTYNECFDAVINFAVPEGANRSYKYNNYADFNLQQPVVAKEAAGVGGTFDIFLKDRIKGHMVVMGIEGNVNTTEVGIFFSKIKPKETKLEISSLSTTAKERVAKMVFDELGRLYPAVK